MGPYFKIFNDHNIGRAFKRLHQHDLLCKPVQDLSVIISNFFPVHPVSIKAADLAVIRRDPYHLHCRKILPVKISALNTFCPIHCAKGARPYRRAEDPPILPYIIQLYILHNFSLLSYPLMRIGWLASLAAQKTRYNSRFAAIIPLSATFVKGGGAQVRTCCPHSSGLISQMIRVILSFPPAFKAISARLATAS